METPSKVLEQKTSKQDLKMKTICWLLWINLYEEDLSQPLPAKNEQFKLAVTFLTGYKGIFNVTTKKINSISQHQLTMWISRKLLFLNFG